MIFFKCYNLLRNTCTGACQGCSDCLMANTNPTRLRMLVWILKETYDFFLWKIEWKSAINKSWKKMKESDQMLSMRKQHNPILSASTVRAVSISYLKRTTLASEDLSFSTIFLLNDKTFFKASRTSYYLLDHLVVPLVDL